MQSHLPTSRTSNVLTMCEDSEKEHTPGLAPSRNVLGTELQCCCADVRGTGIGTGFYRDGHCSTGPQDEGRHTVCVQATTEFLRFSAAVGNPLHVPIPEYMFPGVQPGDRWCLCAARWAQALEAEEKGLVSGVVPKLYLLATHEKTLQHVTLEQLMAHALDAEEASAEIARLDEMRTKLQKSVFG
eukprot:6204639-Pleurochrysis_carterae.AAC.1